MGRVRAYTVWLVLHRSRPRLAAAAWLFPVLMTAVVIGTGNHYVLDVVGSAALLTLAVLGTSPAVSSAWARRPSTPRT